MRVEPYLFSTAAAKRQSSFTITRPRGGALPRRGRHCGDVGSLKRRGRFDKTPRLI